MGPLFSFMPDGVSVPPAQGDLPAQVELDPLLRLQPQGPAIVDAPGDPADHLLPHQQFHRLAGDKYASLGLDDRAAALTPPSRALMAALAAAARAAGVEAKCR